MKVIIIIILLIAICLILNTQELFITLPSIWWNSTRRTRNMSYDLRGDPFIIPKQRFIWNNSYII